jgi:CubicO group peptidase (beta-lactamase class C family)
MDTITPEDVGFSASRLDRIGAVMQGYVEKGKLPGVVATVARHGKIVYRERFGMMDVEAAKPMQFDTIFRIYSMTKAVASVALMMLYEEGRFQLHDPVSLFIPELADVKVLVDAEGASPPVTDLKRAIAIKHLLTHTAGFTYEFFDDSPVDGMYREASLVDRLGLFDLSREAFIEKLAALPLVSQPGDAWRYSMATDVLGCLIEVVAGVTLDVFLEDRIFRPLGMEDTGFHVPEAKLERFAAMYGPAEHGELKLLDAPAASPFRKPPRFLSGGIGLVSTAADYLRFTQMLLNGGQLEGTRLLGRKTVALMTTNHLPDVLIPIRLQPHTLHGCGFGLGFRVVVNAAQAGLLTCEGEYGWGGAASTSFFIDPKEDLIGLLLTQLMPSRTYPNRNQFKVLVGQALVD